MDYCRNGDLLEYIKNHGPLCEDKAKRYFRYRTMYYIKLPRDVQQNLFCFRQLTSAVQYLHALEIAHRDLKCENIFLTINNSIKLGDFGFARHCIDDLGECILSDTFCGSAAYAAPEILQVR